MLGSWKETLFMLAPNRVLLRPWQKGPERQLKRPNPTAGHRPGHLQQMRAPEAVGEGGGVIEGNALGGGVGACGEVVHGVPGRRAR